MPASPRAPLPRYIWQQPSWPALWFNPDAVGPAIAEARRLQGEVEGKAFAIGIDRAGEVARDMLSQEVLATAALEGEKLDPAAVRASVLRRLGLGDDKSGSGGGPQDRQIDGLVEVLSDAAHAFRQPLDDARLCRWQAALFPADASGLRKIAVGRWRDHDGPMQIISGPIGKEAVHYEAPPSHQVPGEMQRFLQWFANTAPSLSSELLPLRAASPPPWPAPASGPPPPLDGVARAALAHLWFESIRPFEDGNGRIGRAIVDLALAQDRRGPLRLYSLSRQLLDARAAYDDALNRAQRGTGEVTGWVRWFAGQISAACRRSGEVIDRAIEKSRFWTDHGAKDLNARQRKLLQRLLDDGDGGFPGGLTAGEYMKMTGVSKATATRDLAGLLAAQLLWTTGQGKGIRYYIRVPGWTHGVGVGE